MKTITAEFQRVCAGAVLIYSGACNPLGISKAYALACEECRNHTGSTLHSIEWAPARSIHAQLGHLHGVGIGAYADHSPYTPEADTEWCTEVTKATLPIEQLA